MAVLSRMISLRRRCLLVAAVGVATLAAPASAHAGRLIVTGHDAESHCVRDSVSAGVPGACAFVEAGVTWVRGGAPDPAKPVLILDRGDLDFEATVDMMVASGVPVAYQVVDPRSPQFASLAINTDAYSAILVASSKDDPRDPTPQDLNEYGSTPDTDAINARATDIAAFFDAGGGLDVMSGGAAARADSARYYGFLKLTRGGHPVAPPFNLQPIGRTIGWQDARAHLGEQDEINCCETHVSFELPAPESRLKVAETDTARHAVTVVAEANRLASIEESASSAQTVFAGVPGVPATRSDTTATTNDSTGSTTARCVPRSALKISLHRPKGVRFIKLVVYTNGKNTRTISGKTLGTKANTRAFTLKLSTQNTSKIRLVVTTAAGRKLTYRQTFKPCS